MGLFDVLMEGFMGWAIRRDLKKDPKFQVDLAESKRKLQQADREVNEALKYFEEVWKKEDTEMSDEEIRKILKDMGDENKD